MPYLAGPENVKTLAYEPLVARGVVAGHPQAPGSSAPDIELPNLVCSSLDWGTPWLPYWDARCGMKPAMHRKLWEFAYRQGASGQRNAATGARGLGFGCGKEPLASLSSAEG